MVTEERNPLDGELATIGKRMKWARKRAGLSQVELAQQATGNPRKQTVSDWENDKSVPEARFAVEAAKALRVSVLWLLEGHGHPQPTASAEGLPELARQIDMIWAGPGSLAEKERAIEGLAAAYRSAALDKEAAAALERATAARIEAEKAPDRNRPADSDLSWDRIVADLRAAIRAGPHLPPQPDEGT